MRTLLVVLMFCLQAPAFAADPASAPKIAVISLVGDRLHLVSYRLQTGSRIDQNERQSFPLPSDELDVAAARIVSDAVKAARPAATTMPLRVTDRSLHRLFDQAAESAAGQERLKEALRPILRSQGATHLLLVTRLRADARLNSREGYIGSGKLEGLGFYVDRSRRYDQPETGESALGLISPYAYVRITLHNADMQVLREETSMHSSSLTTVGKAGVVDPWEALSAEEKVGALKGLIAEESKRVVPKLLEGV